MRILVTGAQGFVGRAVVSRLVSSGFEVTALSRANTRGTDEHVRSVVGDITDAASLDAAFSGVDALVHLAARLGDEQDSYRVNVEGTQHLVDACKKSGVRHIVYISTASVKIKRKGIYASTKQAAEELLRTSGIKTTILRPSIVYGDLEHGVFASVAKSGTLPFVPVFGTGRWASRPIHVDDVARMIEIALSHGSVQGNTYDVGGPDTLSFDELIRTVSRELFARRARILHVPVSLGMVAASMLGRCMKNPPLTRSNILGSTQDIEWDAGTAFTDFGFVPRTFADGLHAIVREEEKKDADVLSTYLYSRSGQSYRISPHMRERYARARSVNHVGPLHPMVRKTPALLGPIDAATKLLRPHGTFQARILLISALVEADTASAQWLLPRERSVAALFGRTLLLLCSASLKISAGVILSLIPGFLFTYGK